MLTLETILKDTMWVGKFEYGGRIAGTYEELKHLRDELYEQDLISMEGLKQLNMLIGKYTIHQG